MSWLFTILVLVLMEVGLLIEVGRRIGVWPLIGLLVVITVLGRALTRFIMRRHARALESGVDNRPSALQDLLEALIVRQANWLFLFPGFITDAIALLLLFPPTRRVVARFCMTRLALFVAPASPTGSAEWIDVEAVSAEPSETPPKLRLVPYDAPRRRPSKGQRTRQQPKRALDPPDDD